MSTSSLAGHDLNLLVAFDALFNERSVTRAARRMGLSQPAMSHVLSRLRVTFDDELFLRRGTAMFPTPRAEALAVPIQQALALVTEAVAPARPFDPATATRTFRIGSADFSQIVLLPELMRRLAREAPSIDIVVLPTVGDLCAPLTNAELDVGLALVPPPNTPVTIHHEPLFEMGFACVMASNHPLANQR